MAPIYLCNINVLFRHKKSRKQIYNILPDIHIKYTALHKKCLYKLYTNNAI